MKAIIIAGVILLFFLAVPIVAMSDGQMQAMGGKVGYAVQNPNHTQMLGGTSTHAVNGLSVAVVHSPAVVAVKGGK
jgi:hypothetical protein